MKMGGHGLHDPLTARGLGCHSVGTMMSVVILNLHGHRPRRHLNGHRHRRPVAVVAVVATAAVAVTAAAVVVGTAAAAVASVTRKAYG